MLRLLGIPISDRDARHLVATLIAEGTPDALTAAAQISQGVERGLFIVGLSRAERTAVSPSVVSVSRPRYSSSGAGVPLARRIKSSSRSRWAARSLSMRRMR